MNTIIAPVLLSPFRANKLLLSAFYLGLRSLLATPQALTLQAFSPGKYEGRKSILPFFSPRRGQVVAYWWHEFYDQAAAMGAMRRYVPAFGRMGGQVVSHRSSSGGCAGAGENLIAMQTLDFDEEIEKIIAKDSRYPREAYVFVREGLDHTQKRLGKNPTDSVRHVTGQQLLDGIREYCINQFGPMALTVLEEWNIRQCEDFGEIVFTMVENNVLAKTDKDTRDDFKGGYSFDDAFRKPFLPTQHPKDSAESPKIPLV